MSVRHVCDGSDGCMCMYDPDLNSDLKVGSKLIPLDEIVEALENAYHPQNPLSMHPADFVTKKFKGPGHENLRYV